MKVKKKVLQTIHTMTRKQFEALPNRDWDGHTVCHLLVILPSRRIHDSGYRCFSVVAVDKESHPMLRIGGSCDVLMIEGIGGYGDRALRKGTGFPSMVPPKGWCFDILPTSGLLRLWCDTDLKIGTSLSMLEIWSVPKEVTP